MALYFDRFNKHGGNEPDLTAFTPGKTELVRTSEQLTGGRSEDSEWIRYLKKIRKYGELIRNGPIKTTWAQTNPDAAIHKAEMIIRAGPPGITKLISSDSYILVDIGCGDGLISTALAKLLRIRSVIHCDIEDNRNFRGVENSIPFIKLQPGVSIKDSLATPSVVQSNTIDSGNHPYLFLCSHVSHHDPEFFSFRLPDLIGFDNSKRGIIGFDNSKRGIIGFDDPKRGNDILIIKDHNVMDTESRFAAMYSHIKYEVNEQPRSRIDLINFVNNYDRDSEFYFTSYAEMRTRLQQAGLAPFTGTMPQFSAKDHTYVMWFARAEKPTQI